MKTTVRLNSVSGFSENEKAKLQIALKFLETAINSELFKARVLTHTWLGKKTFADNQGFTNEEIYNLIMSGKEVLKPVSDNVIDISLVIYTAMFRGRNVVGFTYPNTSTQWVNRRFFTTMTPAQIAGNLIHEYGHKLGFDHDYKSTKKRPYSVCYAIGKIITDVIEVIYSP